VTTARPAVHAAVRALFDTALAVVRRSSSGQVGIARLAGVVDVEALPPYLRSAVGREFDAALAATSEPIGIKRIERELRSAWGQPPAKVLDALEPEPLAVTPSAQVHRGSLEGTAVAIKVRRPGLERAVRSDLGLLDTLGPSLGRVFGALDVAALLREARERVLDELDLEHAGATQRQFARATRRLEGVVVPAVHVELSAPGVLVTDVLEGPTLADAAPDDAASVARALVALHLGAPRALGLAPADPRADHVVLLAGGDIGVLGTGSAGAVDRRRLDAGLDALAALRVQDRDAFAAAVVRMGLPVDAAEGAFSLLSSLTGELVLGATRLDGPVLAALTDRAIVMAGDALPIAGRLTPDPADLWPLRMLAQLGAVLARLGVEEDWGALALAAGRDGWARCGSAG
jgi:ABC1 atypical kinase-like domain